MGRRKGEGKLIIATNRECIIGDIIYPTRLVIDHQEIPVQPIRIVREATQKEYAETFPQDILIPDGEFKYFYEIESD